MAKKKAQSKLTFEEITDRLEEIRDQLEEGELPLEEVLRSFEEGVSLIRLGTKRLDEAEERIEILMADSGEATTEEVSA